MREITVVLQFTGELEKDAEGIDDELLVDDVLLPSTWKGFGYRIIQPEAQDDMQ